MYINTSYMAGVGLNLKSLIALQIILQKEQTIHSISVSDISDLIDLGYVTYKKDSGELKDLSLTKKGKKILEQVEMYEYSDEIGAMVTELIDAYESEGKILGKKLEVTKRFTWFVGATGFNVSAIKQAVYRHLQKEYVHSLQNLAWKPTSAAFSVRPKLSESQLFSEICLYYGIDDLYTDSTKNVAGKYMMSILKMVIPKRGDKEIYFTGSAKGDLEHQKKIEKLLFGKNLD